MIGLILAAALITTPLPDPEVEMCPASQADLDHTLDRVMQEAGYYAARGGYALDIPDDATGVGAYGGPRSVLIRYRSFRLSSGRTATSAHVALVNDRIEMAAPDLFVESAGEVLRGIRDRFYRCR